MITLLVAAVIVFLSMVVYALWLAIRLLLLTRRNRELRRRLNELNGKAAP